MERYCLVGPTYPFRGGIAHYTTLLAGELRRSRETLFISFTRQYPRWLFPGRSDRDPSRHALKTDVEYLLDPINPLSWRRTWRRIGRWAPQAVVIPWWVPYWAPAWGTLGRAIKRQPGRPRLLFICHNVIPHERGILDAAALRLALGPGDGFVVHSHSDQENLLAHFPRARVEITPLPTYAALGEGDHGALPVEVPAGRPLLLFCGFVRPYKGLDVLLEAMPYVLANRQVHLLVAGEFWNGSESYQNQIERLGIDRAVTVVDRYLTNESLTACIRRADVVVLPYRSATQSAIIQAAFGQRKPVITTHVGGLAEVVDDGRTGLIAPPEDPQALASAVERFFAEDMGPAMAAQIAGEQERFSWARLVESLDRLASAASDRESRDS